MNDEPLKVDVENEGASEVEDIKIRLGEPVEVTEDEPAAKAESGAGDVTSDLGRFGRQLGQSIKAAFNSPEWERLEHDFKAGAKAFASEVEQAVQELRASPSTQRAQAEAAEIRGRVESGELADKTRAGIIEGLRRLSQEIDRVADHFAAEKGAKPPADEPPLM
ncbi:MAG: hypothetical protein ACRDHL_00115 [Candidatus Promineifilaceae bacterium]